jgi:nucleotide-binding universal stress UspA family protein
MYKNILLAVDGSGTADLALAEAARLAGTGSTVRVVAVVDRPGYLYAALHDNKQSTETVQEALRRQGQSALDRAGQGLRDLGTNVEMVLLEVENEDGIADQIVREARHWPADLIVLGTHGRRGLRRALLGSVAEEVLRQAAQPVLLVRTPSPALLGALNPGEVYREWPEDEVLGG